MAQDGATEQRPVRAGRTGKDQLVSIVAPPEDELLADLTGEEQAWKAHLLANPDLFLLRYFGHRLQRLEPFHLDLVHVATSVRRGMVLYPAGHGKTTLVSELLPIWALSKDPNVRIAIIAKNDDEAKSIMRS